MTITYLKETCIIIVFCTYIQSANADIWDAIFNQLAAQTGIQQTIQEYTQSLPAMQQALTSQNSWGNFNYNPNLQSWGNNTQSWNSILTLYQQGGGSGVGNIAKQLNKQFPIQTPSTVYPNANSIDAQYYQVQSQTALAARAASQFDYNNIQNEIANLQTLHDQINNTEDLKSSMDLSNRFQYESTMLEIELLRLTALNSQVEAVTAQGQSNAVVDNANFSN